MSLVGQVAKLPNFRLPGGNLNMSFPQKVTVISVTVGVMVLGFLARYLRRRRRVVNVGNLQRLDRRRFRGSQAMKSPNGEAAGGRRSASPSVRGLQRQASLLSADRLSVASGSLGGGAAAGGGGGGAPAGGGGGGPLPLGGPGGCVEPGALLSPQQLGLMGMEALDTAVNYWEDALAAYTASGRGSAAGAGPGPAGPLAVTSAEEAEFVRDLQRLLDAAVKLQAESEAIFLDQRSALFRTDSSSRLLGDGASSYLTSTAESFVSAQDEVADLREFEEFAEMFPDLDTLPLYQGAVHQLEEVGIAYRCLRTEMVRCASDAEYLAKLHCLRQAFQLLLRDPDAWQWCADSGRQLLADLLLFADKDPKDFLVAYEEMLDFLQDHSHWAEMEQELSLRGVKAITFYDVVMDYILMDAFDDLESPPTTVTAVVQNRWLSNGFKETALSTAVSSVLKAKRRMLKYPGGFMAHFYAISEHMSPLMAWGFLGPEEDLRLICHYFKEQVLGFLVDIFSFQRSRFSTMEELAEDVLRHMRARVEAVSVKMTAAQG